MPKIDLSRRLEALEADDEAGIPIYLHGWIYDDESAARYERELEAAMETRRATGRDIITFWWGDIPESTGRTPPDAHPQYRRAARPCRTGVRQSAAFPD